MKLLKSTATVGGATIISRILGFVRDVVLARLFGASGTTDAFFLAFRIPNLMRRMFADDMIEDLWLDFRCATIDLSWCRLVAHRNGPLERWVRASASVLALRP